MEEIYMQNNQVTICGCVESELIYSHELYGEKFYIMQVSVQRRSSTSDRIPVVISERLIDADRDYRGKAVMVSGQFRSYNMVEKRLVLVIFARDIWLKSVKEKTDLTENEVYLNGYICREPKYRQTPMGREITDVLVAVNRAYGKTDYLPCICWGRNARYLSRMSVGTHLILKGRVQSRVYYKKISNSVTEERVAYEISVNHVENLMS